MKSIHALLVDDDKAALETMAMILEMDEYQVSTAFSGQMALERLESAEGSTPAVDFMVVDLDMSNLSGIELLTEMRRRGHDIPVMVVTGFASKNTVVELLRHGVADFLDKPIHVEEFRIRVHRIANEALRRRKEKPSTDPEPIASHFRSSTVLDLGNLGIPYALCRLLDESPQNKVVLAARKRFGYDILLADARGADSESFYVSVLIKTFFDKARSREIPALEFMRELNQVIMAGALRKHAVDALFIRIYQAERRIEILPAGYPCQCFIGLGDSRPQMCSFTGDPLGAVADPGRTVCEMSFDRGDRLFIYSECMEPGFDWDKTNGQEATRLKEAILSHGPATVDRMAESIWRDLKPEAGNCREQDAVLLGLELP
jgi:DNA-binding response OmpR family regulator